MSSNNRNISGDNNSRKGQNVSGQGGSQSGPVAGGADNTRGENKPSREGSSGGAKAGKNTPNQNSPQGSHANPSDNRGADSSDKEFRNNQPNASTLKGHKNKEGLGNEKE
ncbi:hypothetical protein [Pontibacter ruber]|uniref:Stress protein n=1 Tax=Pontibacter ruber TaxID=1343895 RepID=A0ABW5D1U6_9BACT|nr:hypothetical protein [Pontibacter ruber]